MMIYNNIIYSNDIYNKNMNAQVEALEVTQEVKDAMIANPDIVLSESLKLAYKQQAQPPQSGDKKLVKLLAQQLKKEPKFSKYTDKQLKEIVKTNLKLMNDKKRDEFETEKLRILNSTNHIIDFEF